MYVIHVNNVRIEKLVEEVLTMQGCCALVRICSCIFPHAGRV